MKKASIYSAYHMTTSLTTREMTSHVIQHAPSTRQGTQLGAVEIEDKKWNEEED
jgi:hypothetical protein